MWGGRVGCFPNQHNPVPEHLRERFSVIDGIDEWLVGHLRRASEDHCTGSQAVNIRIRCGRYRDVVQDRAQKSPLPATFQSRQGQSRLQAFSNCSRRTDSADATGFDNSLAVEMQGCSATNFKQNLTSIWLEKARLASFDWALNASQHVALQEKCRHACISLASSGGKVSAAEQCISLIVSSSAFTVTERPLS